MFLCKFFISEHLLKPYPNDNDGGSTTTMAAQQRCQWLHDNSGGSTTMVAAHYGGGFTLIGWYCV